MVRCNQTNGGQAARISYSRDELLQLQNPVTPPPDVPCEIRRREQGGRTEAWRTSGCVSVGEGVILHKAAKAWKPSMRKDRVEQHPKAASLRSNRPSEMVFQQNRRVDCRSHITSGLPARISFSREELLKLQYLGTTPPNIPEEMCPTRGQGKKSETQRTIGWVSFREDVNLHKAETAWKPSVKKTRVEQEETVTQELFKRMRSILNKLTPEKFEPLMKQVWEVSLNTEERLQGVGKMIYEKAICEMKFAGTYAKMCFCLKEITVPCLDEPNVHLNFRLLMLSFCRKEFLKVNGEGLVMEKEWQNLNASDMEEGKQGLKELGAKLIAHRRRAVGSTKFLGELFKLGMVRDIVILRVIGTYLDTQSEESLECLCCLIITTGSILDRDTFKPQMDGCFCKLKQIVEERKTTSRIRFILQDVMDLRQNNWVPRKIEQGPKAINLVHMEAERESQPKLRKVEQQFQSKIKKSRSTIPISDRYPSANTIQSCQTCPPLETLEKPAGEENIVELAVEEAVSEPASEDDVAKPVVEKTVSEPAGKENVTKPASEENIAELVMEKTVSEPAGKENVTKPASEENIAELAVAFSLLVLYDPQPLETLEKPAGEEKIVELAVEDTVFQPAGEDDVAKLVVEKTVPELDGKENVDKLVMDKTISEPAGKENVAKPASEENITEMVMEKTVSEPAGKENVTKPASEENIEELAVAFALLVLWDPQPLATLEKPAGEEKIVELAVEDTVFQPAGEDDEAKLVLEKTVPEPDGKENVDKLVMDKTISEPAGKENVAKPASEENIEELAVAFALLVLCDPQPLATLEKPAGEEKIVELAVEDTVFQPAGEDDEAKLVLEKTVPEPDGKENVDKLVMDKTISEPAGKENVAKPASEENIEELAVAFALLVLCDPQPLATLEKPAGEEKIVELAVEDTVFQPAGEDDEAKLVLEKTVPEPDGKENVDKLVMNKTISEPAGKENMAKPASEENIMELAVEENVSEPAREDDGAKPVVERAVSEPAGEENISEPLEDVVAGLAMEEIISEPVLVEIILEPAVVDSVEYSGQEDTVPTNNSSSQPCETPKCRETVKIISGVSFNAEIELHKAENSWRPSMKKNTDKTQELLRQMRSILNKITPEKFEQLVSQVSQLNIDTTECLQGVVNTIFEKAIFEPKFSSIYAKMCHRLKELKAPINDCPEVTLNFQLTLASRCWAEFYVTNERRREEVNVTVDRRRALGNMKFLGELFKLGLAEEQFIHRCIAMLLDRQGEDALECLCCLLSTVGSKLDIDQAKCHVDKYARQMEQILKEGKTSSRTRFMLQDILDLRLNNWAPRSAEHGPKPISQVHKEAQLEAQQERAKVEQQPLAETDKWNHRGRAMGERRHGGQQQDCGRAERRNHGENQGPIRQRQWICREHQDQREGGPLNHGEWQHQRRKECWTRGERQGQRGVERWNHGERQDQRGGGRWNRGECQDQRGGEHWKRRECHDQRGGEHWNRRERQEQRGGEHWNRREFHDQRGGERWSHGGPCPAWACSSQQQNEGAPASENITSQKPARFCPRIIKHINAHLQSPAPTRRS